MVNSIIGMKLPTKMLMDGGSNLNIMYAEMLDAMGIDRSLVRPIGAPFHSIVPRKQAVPLGQIDLPITFRNSTNYRTETLTFEMLGLCGVIKIGTSFQCAYECEVECCEHAMAIVASKELATIKEEVTEEALDLKLTVVSFEPVEGAKEVLIDTSGSEGKVVCIGTTLSSE
ncbi:uncharacterized protein [Miscanthus floridulus]|uniref:uncharacterized protein n=1 Tax=Miscanthus floridulus TaxID=154761 RepID=UPI00345B45B2